MDEKEQRGPVQYRGTNRGYPGFFAVLRPKGFTLLEMSIAVVLLGVLVAYGVPRFQKAFEQSRLDMAAMHLESVWTAQRLYRTYGTQFSTSITDLSNYLDTSFVVSQCNNTPPCAPSCDFCYAMASSAENAFEARATRNSAKTSYWSGYLSITEAGTITGYTSGHNGEVVTPSKL